jgi:hypothetical protein
MIRCDKCGCQMLEALIYINKYFCDNSSCPLYLKYLDIGELL